MQIVSALDVHRRQITFRTLELASGETRRGRISPVAPEPLREWLAQFEGQEAEFVLEETTGWRFVVEMSPLAPSPGSAGCGDSPMLSVARSATMEAPLGGGAR